MSLLTIQDACVTFRTGGQVVHALDHVSVAVEKGECVAVVGESGCGKTTLARSILGLQRLDSGSILMESAEDGLLAKRIGMVWQDPYASLDPRWTVSRLMSEPARLAGVPCDVGALLSEVGLDPVLGARYPHQLSGGQRQRVAIGRAVALRPPLVICDEPTAALDLSVQAQILNLLRDLQQELNCAILYISHDLQTVRFIAQRVVVMRQGKVVESGTCEEVFDTPKEAYTQQLLAAAPNLSAILS